MFYCMILFVWEFVLYLVAVMRLAEDEKDLEILLLRQQLRIVERNQERGPQLPRWQKVPLVAMVMRLREYTAKGVTDSLRLFKPETVIGWHRALVQRKWTYRQGKPPGRPPLNPELEQSILQLAKDNPRWGYRRLVGEMRNSASK